MIHLSNSEIYLDGLLKVTRRSPLCHLEMDVQSVKIPGSLIADPDSLLPFASTTGGTDNFPRSLRQCMCQLAFPQPHRAPTSLETQTSVLFFPVLTVLS